MFSSSRRNTAGGSGSFVNKWIILSTANVSTTVILPRGVSCLLFHLLRILWTCNNLSPYLLSLMQSVSVHTLIHRTLKIPVSKQKLISLENRSPHRFLLPIFLLFFYAQKLQLLLGVLPCHPSSCRHHQQLKKNRPVTPTAPQKESRGSVEDRGPSSTRPRTPCTNTCCSST